MFRAQSSPTSDSPVGLPASSSSMSAASSKPRHIIPAFGLFSMHHTLDLARCDETQKSLNYSAQKYMIRVDVTGRLSRFNIGTRLSMKTRKNYLQLCRMHPCSLVERCMWKYNLDYRCTEDTGKTWCMMGHTGGCPRRPRRLEGLWVGGKNILPDVRQGPMRPHWHPPACARTPGCREWDAACVGQWLLRICWCCWRLGWHAGHSGNASTQRTPGDKGSVQAESAVLDTATHHWHCLPNRCTSINGQPYPYNRHPGAIRIIITSPSIYGSGMEERSPTNIHILFALETTRWDR